MGLKGKLLTLGSAVFLGMLLAPRKGKETRRDLKVKYHQVKRDVARRAVRVKKLSQKGYEEIVRDVLHYYKKAKKLNDAEMRELERDLKGRWVDILMVLKERPKVKPRRRAAVRTAKPRAKRRKQ